MGTITNDSNYLFHLFMIKEVAFYSDQLRKGKVILYPTDTIWGIGCDATNLSAVDYVYKIKKRDRKKPCILLVESIDHLKKYVKDLHPRIENLLLYHNKPTTIIYKANQMLHPAVLNDDGTVAIRLIKQEFCSQLIAKLGRPLISTSANIQGEPFPQTFEEISDEIIDNVDIVVERHYESETNTEPSIMLSFNDSGDLKFIRS